MAALLGKPLMPHQRHIADVALEIDPETGLPAYGMVVLVGPRQGTGKTELLLPVMAHRCMGFGDEQRVLYTAQTATDARKKWEDIHVARLLKSPLGSRVDVRYRLTAEAIQWPNGSAWSPGSATAKTGGTGDTLDLGVIDEAWSQGDTRTELGMRPAMMTRLSSQLWVTSMVPGPTRIKHLVPRYLRSLMKTGRARVKAGVRQGVAYFEFGAPRGADPGAPSTWRAAIPGLGFTVTEAKVRADYEAMVAAGQLADFCAEYLSWDADEYDDSGWDVFDRRAWSDCQDPESTIVGPRAFAVESSHDLSYLSIGVAGRTATGLLRHHELVDRFPADVGRLVGWMKKRQELWRPVAWVIDPNGPAGYLIQPVEQELGIEVAKPLGRDVAGACASLYVGVCGGQRDVRVRPSGGDLEVALNAAARCADWRDRGDARVFDRRVDDGAEDSTDVAPVMSLALAEWGLTHASVAAFNPGAFSA